MRIVSLCDPDLVNSNYRAYQPLHILSRQGHDVHVSRVGEPRLQLGQLLAADVVHIHRAADPATQRLVAQLNDAGVGVVWDNDDDVTALPKGNPHYARFGGANAQRVARAIAGVVRAADVVTTPSARLADQYRAAGARDVRVLENYLPREFSSARPRSHEGVVVAWLAGLEHQIDYQQLRLRRSLEGLLDAHPQLRVMSIGLGLGLQNDRYEHMPRVDFLDLARTLAAADIGIAPLVDIPWNQARSDVKLKEYAAAGLPWLASPVGAYVGMGDREGGLLVPDDGWHDALDDLIVNKRKRRRLARRAAKWAQGQGIERHAGIWEEAFRDASDAARMRVRHVT